MIATILENFDALDEVIGNKVEIIASIAHEVNRAWCIANDDHSQKPWEETAENIKASARDGVQAIIDGVVSEPGDSHRNWLAFKLRDGWVYGEKKDEVAKTHYCMVPFEELSDVQQKKDHLFVGIVKNLLGLQ